MSALIGLNKESNIRRAAETWRYATKVSPEPDSTVHWHSFPCSRCRSIFASDVKIYAATTACDYRICVDCVDGQCPCQKGEITLKTAPALLRRMSSAVTFFNREVVSESLSLCQLHRVFHYEVSISAPRLDLESKSQQILTLARARSIWDFQPLGAKTRSMPVDFSDALDVKPVHEDTSENDAASDCCLSLAGRDVGA
jgi:hypothetical protein